MDIPDLRGRLLSEALDVLHALCVDAVTQEITSVKKSAEGEQDGYLRVLNQRTAEDGKRVTLTVSRIPDSYMNN